MKPDIIFLSSFETNADENWSLLSSRFPRAKRVHGVRGILQAHQEAARKSDSHYFFLVDGDNRILRDFQFALPESLDPRSIYVWRCLNPANDLVYGFGAVKLYNKSLLLHDQHGKVSDLATTVAHNYQIIHEVASETHFFATAREAWRGSFRECAKLARNPESQLENHVTRTRLETWCSRVNDVPHASWILRGAKMGREFGDSKESLTRINDYDWLNQTFENRVSQ